MSIPAVMSRIAVYYRRNGWWATACRAALGVRRVLFSNHMVIHYCDLSGQRSWPAEFPSYIEIERKRAKEELSADNLQQIVSCWNSRIARRHIDERFGQGASLWTIKSEGGLAGYGWTLSGRTMEPHYLVLGQHDVHLFDFYVFPRYRGQGMNPFLVTYILRSLAAEAVGRAFIEAAEWNRQQLASLAKTPFRRLGRARKSTILGRTIVCWAKN